LTVARIITLASTIPSLGIDENTLMFIRGVGPIGYPGAAEVVNMQPPDALLKKGITELPCIGDGRQSGTFRVAVDPQRLTEAAAGGGLALLKTVIACASISGSVRQTS